MVRRGELAPCRELKNICSSWFEFKWISRMRSCFSAGLWQPSAYKARLRPQHGPPWFVSSCITAKGQAQNWGLYSTPEAANSVENPVEVQRVTPSRSLIHLACCKAVAIIQQAGVFLVHWFWDPMSKEREANPLNIPAFFCSKFVNT